MDAKVGVYDFDSFLMDVLYEMYDNYTSAHHYNYSLSLPAVEIVSSLQSGEIARYIAQERIRQYLVEELNFIDGEKTDKTVNEIIDHDDYNAISECDEIVWWVFSDTYDAAELLQDEYGEVSDLDIMSVDFSKLPSNILVIVEMGLIYVIRSPEIDFGAELPSMPGGADGDKRGEVPHYAIPKALMQEVEQLAEAESQGFLP